MIGFKAFTFKGKKTALKTFHMLEDYPAENYWIDDTAVVSRNKHGHLRVHSTWAQDESGKTGLGRGDRRRRHGRSARSERGRCLRRSGPG